ncbi:NAD-dependent epimerase/dehydratase family protein [Bdellovibrionota bacterium FG-2]
MSQSSKRALVLGGTKFFGRHLVRSLLDQGIEVTLATRGITPDPFTGRVQHLKVERTDRRSLENALRGTSWDLVYDQICYSPDAATLACETLKGRGGRYLLTSTQSVYTKSGTVTEEDYEPCHYPVRMGSYKELDYGEGKRLAEAVFFQRAAFPVAAIRFPYVLGMDDYTERLKFHVDRIKAGKPIGIQNLDAQIPVIQSTEAGQFPSGLSFGTAIALVRTPGNTAERGFFAASILTIAAPIAGLILLEQNGNSGLSFSPLSFEQATGLGVSPETAAIYNAEIEELNAVADSVNSELTTNTNPTIELSATLWNQYRPTLSPETAEVAGKVLTANFSD